MTMIHVQTFWIGNHMTTKWMASDTFFFAQIWGRFRVPQPARAGGMAKQLETAVGLFSGGWVGEQTTRMRSGQKNHPPTTNRGITKNQMSVIPNMAYSHQLGFCVFNLKHLTKTIFPKHSVARQCIQLLCTNMWKQTECRMGPKVSSHWPLELWFKSLKEPTACHNKEFTPHQPRTWGAEGSVA